MRARTFQRDEAISCCADSKIPQRRAEGTCPREASIRDDGRMRRAPGESYVTDVLSAMEGVFSLRHDEKPPRRAKDSRRNRGRCNGDGAISKREDKKALRKGRASLRHDACSHRDGEKPDGELEDSMRVAWISWRDDWNLPGDFQ
jgi:hypothetical protein